MEIGGATRVPNLWDCDIVSPVITSKTLTYFTFFLFFILLNHMKSQKTNEKY